MCLYGNVVMMTSKIRLLTRMYDLSVEGESVEEVEELLNVLEAAGLIKENFRQSASPNAPNQSDITVTDDSDMQMVNGEMVNLLTSGVAGGPLVFEGSTPSATSMPLKTSSAISAVTRRDDDIFVLSPKFPPNPSGDRSGDAALIILAAYDFNKESPVTGSRLIKSLKNTGYRVDRVDKIFAEFEQDGLVLPEGARRGRRYRLSESGRGKAQQLADELRTIAGVPKQ